MIMPTSLQERRIGEAWKQLGRHATARQIWEYLSTRYQRPGFKSRQSVEQILRILQGRSGPL